MIIKQNILEQRVSIMLTMNVLSANAIQGAQVFYSKEDYDAYMKGSYKANKKPKEALKKFIEDNFTIKEYYSGEDFIGALIVRNYGEE